MLKLKDIDDSSYENIYYNGLDESVDRPRINDMSLIIKSCISDEIADLQNIEQRIDDLERIYKQIFNQQIVLVGRITGEESNEVFRAVNDKNRKVSLSSVDIAWSDICDIMDAKKKNIGNRDKVIEYWDDILECAESVDLEAAVRDALIASDNNNLTGIKKSNIRNKINIIIDNNYGQKNNLEEWMAHLSDLVKSYREIADCEIEYKNVSDELQQHASHYNKMNQTAPRLVMLGAICRDLPGDQTVRLCEMAEKLAYTRSITGKKSPQLRQQYQYVFSGTKSYDSALDASPNNKVLGQDNWEDAAKEILKQRQPTPAGFVKHFADTEFGNVSGIKRYTLKIIESVHYQNNDWRSDIVHFGVDHIAPKKARKSTQWTKELSDLDTFDLYKHHIGNLTLLTQKENNKANLDSYSDKHQSYYKNHSDFEMTSELAKQYDENTHWDVDKIQDRSDDLANIARDIWIMK